MKTLFTTVYELLCGKNQDIADYRDEIYGSVGLLTLIIAIVIALFFYIGLGRWRNIWHTRVHWAITIMIAALVGFTLAYTVSRDRIGSIDGYLIQFALLNAAMLAVYFMLLSLVFKRFSIYSKRTPF
jgi:hypothetical protein